MKVGISTACFYPFINTEDTLDIIKELGFDLCEVFLESNYETEEFYCNELRNKAEKLGICIHSVHAFNASFEPYLFDRYERRRREMENKFIDVCKAGRIFGAKYYTYHGITKTMPNDNMDIISERVSTLCDISESYGLRLSQENVSWCKSGDPEYLRQLDEKIKNKLYYTLDIKQSVRSSHSPLDYLKLYKNNLSTVHINDSNIESTCLLPGEGDMNLKKIIKEASAFNKEVPLIIEVYRENYKEYKELGEAKDYIETLINQI